jgi:uncharacterized protein (DUF58 family)
MDAVYVYVRRAPSLFLIPTSLCVTGVALFVALLYSQKDLAVLCLFVLGLAGAAKSWAHWSAAGIECRFTVDGTRLFAGDSIVLRAHVGNRKFLPVWMSLKVPANGMLTVAGEEASITGEGSLLWYQGMGFQWDVPVNHRGVYRFGKIMITTGDLFGFFLSEKEAGADREIIVYPRLRPLKSISFGRRDFFGYTGAESPVKDPVYILGTTDYLEGHPAKQIHWKASARRQRLQEKVFEPSLQEKVLLVVDVDRFVANRREEEFEHTLEVVASLAVRLHGKGCPLGFATNGLIAGDKPSIIPVSRNGQQLQAILEALARLKMEEGRDLMEMLQGWRDIPWGTTVLFFSFEAGELPSLAGQYLRRRRTPTTFFFWKDPRSDAREGAASGMTHSLEELWAPGGSPL